MHRVKQIVSSPEEIVVMYHDVPIWIDSYDENANTARVHTRSNPNDLRDVEVAELNER
ncbi:H-type small acid-soluble spore protein [Bacillus salitolerans]|uniref:H-type small acid-soluble spore protein n=1 Tax=Bacillus salitolerans TaxID=1437434 RepID=A0ABW4LN65_9BACI